MSLGLDVREEGKSAKVKSAAHLLMAYDLTKKWNVLTKGVPDDEDERRDYAKHAIYTLWSVREHYGSNAEPPSTNVSCLTHVRHRKQI